MLGVTWTFERKRLKQRRYIYGSVHRVHGQSIELKEGALSRGNRRGKDSTYFERVCESEKWKEYTNERDNQKHASFPHFMW